LKIKTKKAVTFQFLMMIPRIVFLAIVMFSILFLIRSAIVTQIDVFEVETELFTLNTIYAISETQPETTRLELATVDKEKLLNGKLETRIHQILNYEKENRKIAAKLTFKTGIDEDIIKEIIYNKDYYKDWNTKSRALWNKGPGGVRDKTTQIPCIIKEPSKEERCVVEIHIIVPNS
jgi:hypothetical protein